MNVKQENAIAWTEVSWLRRGSSGSLLCIQSWTIRFHTSQNFKMDLLHGVGCVIQAWHKSKYSLVHYVQSCVQALKQCDLWKKQMKLMHNNYCILSISKFIHGLKNMYKTSLKTLEVTSSYIQNLKAKVKWRTDLPRQVLSTSLKLCVDKHDKSSTRCNNNHLLHLFKWNVMDIKLNFVIIT
jgi:hypothetical protein